MEPVTYTVRETTVKSIYVAMIDAAERLGAGTMHLKVCIGNLEMEHPSLKSEQPRQNAGDDELTRVQSGEDEYWKAEDE